MLAFGASSSVKINISPAVRGTPIGLPRVSFIFAPRFVSRTVIGEFASIAVRVKLMGSGPLLSYGANSILARDVVPSVRVVRRPACAIGDDV